MELAAQDFPPLSNLTPKDSPSVLPSGSYADNVSIPAVKQSNFPVSFVSPAPKLSFRGNDLAEGANFWNLSLVGYSIGPRPYYERLLAAMKKVWSIKGAMSLLSLADGFFLLKFSALEDLEMVWNGGPWFFLGKPFILQRWSPKFKPVRDESSSIPLWIKIMDLPLALWTPLGISRIASFIGVPISVDTLTANRCGSLFHPFSLCSSNPNPKPIIPPSNRQRGRSSSRNPNQRNQLPSSKPPIPRPSTLVSEASPVVLDGNVSTLNLSKPIIHTTSPAILSPDPKQLLTSAIPGLSKDLTLPNLNLPMDVASSSEHSTPPSSILPPKIHTANKFDSLQTDEADLPPQDNPPSVVDTPGSSSSPAQSSTDCSSSNYLQNSKVKSKSPKEAKKVKPKTAKKGAISFELSVVYASNNENERRVLWDDIQNVASSLDLPWIILGDFNCYRFDFEKAGGNPPSQSYLGELNKCVFECGIQDLASVGLLFTWFNQRVDMLIHIKLDMMLAFSKPHENSPISDFYQSLRHLKSALKRKNWSSSHFLTNAINDLKNSQNCCLVEIQSDPLNPVLINTLKEINEQLATLQSAWSSWISQRAKAYWLLKGEDDLGFLFAKIKARNNRNCLREISTDNGSFTSHSNISKAIIEHFKVLFNKPISAGWEDVHIPVGIKVPA
ncbi:uncharacterized protein LOC110092635 [Dendrobium catenatum]|uniref:uncharacterized protein LOC110092635 n=1 Tax=Dendrobium catenatum TaxID=906689 RepID=UPI00109F7E6F|nr:uncharacterized protein LOC110092635 [Dendrobium catenatum]